MHRLKEIGNMAGIKLYSSLLVFYACILITAIHAHKQPSREHIALFVFGDSFYDVGNNNYINTTTDFQANFLPYGMTFFTSPTGRHSDGRLIPDFIAEYANLPFTKPYLEPGFSNYSDGVNFASAGAGSLVETFQGSVIDLNTQLKHFNNVAKMLSKNLGKRKAKMLLSSSVYLFSVGANDYLFPFLTNSTVLQSYSYEEFLEMVIGNITTVIKEVYKSGGRKFGFQNLGALGCLPGARALSGENCLEDLNHIVELHNKAFSAALLKLEHLLKGFKYSLFDAHTFFNEVLNNPSKYGFKEVNIACCGSGPFRGFQSCGGKRAIKEYELCDNPTEYFMFDLGHTSESANQQVAELMWSGTHDSIGPFSVEKLFNMG